MNLQKAKEIVKQEESYKATKQHTVLSSAGVNTLCHLWVDVPNPKKGKKRKQPQNNGPNWSQQQGKKCPYNYSQHNGNKNKKNQD